jgi:hypothetical protein
MRLEWKDELSVTVITLSNGEELVWECKTWQRSRIKHKLVYHDDLSELVSPDIFRCINSYLSILPIDNILSIEGCYKEIYYLFENKPDLNLFNKQLNNLIYRILVNINWEHFRVFCLNEGNLNLSVGIKTHLGDKDSSLLTYFTKDYENLVVFSVLLKLIMPIWGSYCSYLEEDLGIDYVLINSVDIIRNSYIENNPAVIRLENYVNVFTKDKIKTKGYSINTDISTEDVPAYMLALVLWKKVCIFDPRAHDKSIIRDVHDLLKDKCERVTKGGPNNRSKVNERGEEISIADTCKVAQRVPPMVEVALNHSIRDLPLHLGLSSYIEEINKLDSSISRAFEKREFHASIISLLTKDILGIRSFDLLDINSLLYTISTCSVLLNLWGFKTLSLLLITIPIERDIYSFDANNTNAQTNISLEIQNRLNSIYKFVFPLQPGLRLIESVCKEVNMFSWNIKEGSIESLSTEIAELIIYINTKEFIYLQKPLTINN